MRDVERFGNFSAKNLVEIVLKGEKSYGKKCFAKRFCLKIC